MSNETLLIQNFKIGVLKEVYKQKLINDKELQKAIEIIKKKGSSKR